MSSWNIVTTESGSCSCGNEHNKGDTLWSGFITKRAAEGELETSVRKKHDIDVTIEKQDET